MGPFRRARTARQLFYAVLWLAPPLPASAAPETAADGEPRAEAVLATLPFDPTSPAQTIVIDLAPKGNARKLPFQLDTGATDSVVSPLLARAMGVKVSRTKQDAYRRKTALGRDLQFYVDTRRTDTSSNVGVEFGLLGGSFLSEYVVELDFANHRVRFLDPKRYEVPTTARGVDEAVLPLEIVANRPGIVAKLNGRAVTLLLDTGTQPGVMLSGAIATGAGIESSPRPDATIQGVVGKVDAALGEVERLELGPIAMEKVPAWILPNGFFNLGFPGDSVLGYELLSQFLVRIDYPRQRIWLRRDASDTTHRRESQESEQAATRAPGRDATAMSWTIPPEPEDAYAAQPPRDGSPDPAEEATDTRSRQVWLEWRTPDPGDRVAGPVGWVGVEGWAGVGIPIRHDVVIAIDVSGSTAVASGADVDADGELGKQRRRIESWRSFNPHHLSSDTGDTVLAAEITAARRLIDVLDPDRTRIGIVAFSDVARVLAPLGSDRERLERVLHDLDQAFGSGATNLAEAIARGAEALLLESPGRVPRRKTLLILSDGWPTAPGSAETAAQEAAKEAIWAARDGVRIDSFGLGLEQVSEWDVYAWVAEKSGGKYRPLAQPAQIVQELPRIDLADVAGIEIVNTTTGASGRALRILPDGSFDSVVMLAAGENRIRVTARDAAGNAHSDERVVAFDQRALQDAEEAARFDRQLAKLRDTLEQRRQELALIAEIQARRTQERSLEVRADEMPR